MTTPRTVICCTRSMPWHNGGKFCDFLALTLGNWNMISLHFLVFNRKLLPLAQSWTCCNSSSQVWLLSAAMTKYVSSANLTSSLPEWVGSRSAVLTTYAAGPKPEPWTTLANMSAGSDTSPWNFVQWARLVKKSLIQLYTVSGRFNLGKMFRGCHRRCHRFFCQGHHTTNTQIYSSGQASPRRLEGMCLPRSAKSLRTFCTSWQEPVQQPQHVFELRWQRKTIIIRHPQLFDRWC